MMVASDKTLSASIRRDWSLVSRTKLILGRGRTDFEAEPIAKVTIDRCPEVRPCPIATHLPVHVDIKTASNPRSRAKRAVAPLTTHPSSTR